ncbi:MAG TPA: hypothetical protein VFD70_27885 [Anaerolineae bacterium]|nr:hypothetical protein [Anaerolineae bacterium]
MKIRIVLGLTLLALTLLWVPTQALAHGAPAISVTPNIVAPGGTITVKGTTMGASEDFKMSLEGVKFRADFGSASSDANENMTAQYTIPGDTPAGDYQVKALSGDGDAATADLTVTATANVMPTPAPGTMAEPSAAPHEIPRSRTPLEIIGLIAVALLSAGVGVVLLRLK